MIKSYNECTEQPLKSHLTRVSLKGRTSHMVQKLGFKPNISRIHSSRREDLISLAKPVLVFRKSRSPIVLKPKN